MSDITIDQIIRSRRRSISLLITQDAKLIVRAPHSTSESFIEDIVRQKASWIKTKQEYFRNKPAIKSRTYSTGEEFLFLGEIRRLRIVDDLPKAVILENDLLISSMAVNNAKDHIGIWYRREAEAYIIPRTKELALANGLACRSIKINSASTRWGSCGYQGAINFTWRLIMAPPRVIDYVIIHELMHIKQRNHSPKFWAEVAARIPDYKRDEHWLNQNSNLMRL